MMPSRRNLCATASASLLLPLGACSKEGSEKEVGAVEDLMREHGVLRRALLVYSETAARIRGGPSGLNAGALNRTAKLFQAFGENYHERKLEEAHIFPRVKKAGGEAGAYVDTLVAQHERGRQITQYIIAQTAAGRLGGDTAPFAHALETFVLMYENHAAREDTIIFPAWKAVLSARELDEMGDKFEDIERAQFGGDGFEKAEKEIASIEAALGFSDLAQFTAPPPPPQQ